MNRWVDPDKVVRVALDAPVPELAKKLRRWMEKQPMAPDLIGRKVAADILGVNSPYISRLHDQGRMPDPIPIEGTAPAYIREEVEALATELRAERKRREEKRKERTE
jgi:predicted DNA-binding transcriptional regulator AlpA